MPEIFKQNEIDVDHLALPSNFEVASIIYQQHSSALLQFQNGVHVQSSCIMCEEMSCLVSNQNEGVLEELTLSQYNKLCPTEAIEIDETGLVQIDKQDCVGCGLCIAACPLGAIYLDENKLAVIEHDNHIFEKSENAQSLGCIGSDVYANPVIDENSELIESIIERIKLRGDNKLSLNRMVQNLLANVGVTCQLTRQGDVNLRMDGLGLIEEKTIVIEIELDTNLDAPRDILDDIAVYCSRYNESLDNVEGLIVSSHLPNKRTEYWELFSDIRNVLGLSIMNVTIAVLLMLVWNRRPINLGDCFLDRDNMSLREYTARALGREVGIATPDSLIEAAK